MVRVQVRVVSDNVCPWCFIGKRNLESAMRQRSDQVEFDVKFRPFSLHNNTMPPEGMDLADYIERVYGMKVDPSSPSSPVNTAGEMSGIHFNHSRRMVNTLDSHRLIAWAQNHGKHLEMVEAIFTNYFENGVDISRNDRLEEIAVTVLGDSVSKQEIHQFLTSDELRSEIRAEISEAKESNISGVPHFTITDESTGKGFILSGGQPPERFIQVFDSILQRQSTPKM